MYMVEVNCFLQKQLWPYLLSAQATSQKNQHHIHYLLDRLFTHLLLLLVFLVNKSIIESNKSFAFSLNVLLRVLGSVFLLL